MTWKADVLFPFVAPTLVMASSEEVNALGPQAAPKLDSLAVVVFMDLCTCTTYGQHYWQLKVIFLPVHLKICHVLHNSYDAKATPLDISSSVHL